MTLEEMRGAASVAAQSGHLQLRDTWLASAEVCERLDRLIMLASPMWVVPQELPAQVLHQMRPGAILRLSEEEAALFRRAFTVPVPEDGA